MTLNIDLPRLPNGRIAHVPDNRRPQSVRKMSMFTDEYDDEQGRVIDVKWKERALVETQRLFEGMITQYTAGPETARPPLYNKDMAYSLCLGDRVVRGVVRLVYTAGIHWRYQLELLALRGAKIQVTQAQMVTLRATPVYYRGYEKDIPDSEWGAAEYVPAETKDRIAAA